jgi:hypothetical protein
MVSLEKGRSRSNSIMPNYIHFKIKTTGSAAGDNTPFRNLASQAEVPEAISIAQKEYDDDLLGFELTYPDGSRKSLTADGKEEL